MKFKVLSKFTSCVLAVALSVVASHAAFTTSFLGTPNGSTSGDTVNATGPVTLSDSTATGDLWDGGDEAPFLHNATRITGSFSATVRVIGQSEAANGRWGKGGIMARNDLTFNSSFAMAQAAAGNGSQPGATDQVPIRLAGRQLHGGATNMYEDNIGAANSNNIFRTDGGVNMTWLRLTYDASTNGFSAGFAPDVAGAPGAWTMSGIRTDVQDSNPADGWYVGLAYSAHSDMSLPAGEGQHSVTFDNFSIIPEPSTALFGCAVAGVLALRRRRR